MSPRPDTPTMTVTGPIRADAFNAPTDPPRWNVIATFTSEAEAHGFAAWCQGSHPAMASAPAGTPLVTWHDTDAGTYTDRLPDPALAVIESTESYTDRETGRGRVVISYRSL